ncbi:MAG: hypothetical protein M3R00_05695, partial [Pseudomonadota bacterium]|nr:hypothetical protein [Pseudomonadota bacterium]
MIRTREDITDEQHLAEWWSHMLPRTNREDAVRLFVIVLKQDCGKRVEIGAYDLLNAAPLTVSAFLGVSACVVYITPSLDAAAKGLPKVFAWFNPSLTYIDIIINKPMNLINSLFDNAMINIYFGNKLLVAYWQRFLGSIVYPCYTKIRRRAHSDTYSAARILQGKNDSFRGKLGRYTYYTVVGTFVYITPSALAGMPMYILDLHQGGHGNFLTTIVFLDYFILSINGVVALIDNLVFPLLAQIPRLISRCCCPIQLQRYQTQDDIETLKAAHLDVLANAFTVVTDLFQRDEYEKLRILFGLLARSKNEEEAALELYLCILHLSTGGGTSRLNRVCRSLTQLLAIGGNVMSLPGYFFETVSGTYDFFQESFNIALSDSGKYFITTLLFTPLT